MHDLTSVDYDPKKHLFIIASTQAKSIEFYMRERMRDKMVDIGVGGELITEGWASIVTHSIESARNFKTKLMVVLVYAYAIYQCKPTNLGFRGTAQAKGREARAHAFASESA